MLDLYPNIKPYATHNVKVDEVHTIYVEECGNKHGIPALFLHGGPGLGCSAESRRFFDPSKYHIILFDQRGAGRSTPHAELLNNTTAHLIADIEKLRLHLGVDKWLLFGGSWGSTLALAYAEQYPERVLAMVLRGIFLLRAKELHWFYQAGGASRIFPDAWAELLEGLSAAEREDVLGSYYKRLMGADEIARMGAAKAWSLWEGVCSTLQPNPTTTANMTQAHTALSLAMIETHYFTHHGFLKEDQLLQDADKIAEIPGVIVHGRYDMVCPVDNAYALQQAWPKARLHVVRDAGHAATEPGIIHALIKATDEFARELEH